MRILAADIGFGTADILIYDSSLAIENCPRLVIPSQTQQVAARIRQATGEGLTVVFSGVTMGGGPCGAALRSHLKAGLPFYTNPAAARTFNDDLDTVRSWGVDIVDDPSLAAPRDSVFIASGDLDLPRLQNALAGLGVDTRFDGAAVAVQDHGFAPGLSNRRRRFELWQQALGNEPALEKLAYLACDIPAAYTRMQSAASLLSGLHLVVAMDTGPAAVLGATLPDPGSRRSHNGEALVANVGNGHTLAAAITGGRIAGLVEHHTRLLDRGRFETMLRRFAAGRLTNEDIFKDGGHGCIPPPQRFSLKQSRPIIVTGPRRDIIRGGRLPLEFAAPFGDMMMTGCFGLVKAFQELASGPDGGNAAA